MKGFSIKMLAIVGVFSLLYGIFAGISDNEIAGAIALCAAALAFGVIAFKAN